MSTEVSHFKLLKQIGNGGMGVVFKAHDKMLDREVAIKMLSEEKADDIEFVQSFLDEAKKAASISHPNIVQIYSIGQEAGKYFLVMELLQGSSLSDMIDSCKFLQEIQVLGVAIDCVKALQAVYEEKRMIHGDIKPHNIFICTNGTTKILDFGLAKLADVEVVPQGFILGSPHYVSPERVAEKTEDFRSDIYSLGASLYHALGGTPPFTAQTVEELALRRTSELPPPLRLLAPSINPMTEKVIHKMLHKNPLMRHSDYSTLIQELEDAKEDAPTQKIYKPTQGSQAAYIEASKSNSNLLIIWAVVGSLLLASGIGTFLYFQKNPPTHTPASAP